MGRHGGAKKPARRGGGGKAEKREVAAGFSDDDSMDDDLWLGAQPAAPPPAVHERRDAVGGGLARPATRQKKAEEAAAKAPAAAELVLPRPMDWAHGGGTVPKPAATGGERAIGPFLEMDIDGYRSSFAKLWGYANVVQCGAPHLAPEGCIVLVSAASPAPQHPRPPATPSPPPPPPSPALPHHLGERRAGPQAQEGAGRARLRGGGRRAARACRRP